MNKINFSEIVEYYINLIPRASTDDYGFIDETMDYDIIPRDDLDDITDCYHACENSTRKISNLKRDIEYELEIALKIAIGNYEF